jgi:hypothetical protein
MLQMSCCNIYNIYNILTTEHNRAQQSTTECVVGNIRAGARMRKSHARHVMATNLLTTTNKFPSAAMARVACLQMAMNTLQGVERKHSSIHNPRGPRGDRLLFSLSFSQRVL